jgi:hypothetical protein
MELGLRNPAATALVEAAAGSAVHEKMVEDIVARLILLGRPELAQSICRSALAAFPGSVGIRIQQGDALRALGRDEDATSIFREVLKVAPGHVGATLSLVSSLRNSGHVDESLAMARDALGRSAAPGLNRAGLLNEVAHCEDARGNYELAFRALTESGAMVLDTPQARSVDSTPYLQRLAAYQSRVLENGLPDQAALPAIDKPRLVFVLGFPRSGVTLLESILSAAPGVVSSGDIPMLGAALARVLSSGVTPEDMLDRMGPQDQELLQQARDDYLGKIEAAFGKGIKVFVDKQPMNVMYLAQIRLLFPEASVVFCQRDPRDACLSCFFQWFALNATNKLFYDWRDTAAFYAQVMDYWFTLEPLVGNAVHCIRYEELVADVPTRLPRLAEALGIPWDDAMLSFAGPDRDQVILTPGKRAVSEAVNTERAQRWKCYPQAIAEVESLLAPAIERLGYA